MKRPNASGGCFPTAPPPEPEHVRTPGPRRPQGAAPRLDRPRRHRHPVPHLLDGPDGPLSRRAGDRRRSEAQRGGAAVDRRHLWVHGRRCAGHHGRTRRPYRPSQGAAHRRRRFRDHLRPGGLLDQRRDADLCACPAGSCRGDAGAVDAVAHPQHVPRCAGAGIRHRHLGGEFFGRRRHRPGVRRSHPGALLVGGGVPHSTCRSC